MKTKKDIEKITDNISPEIGPGILPFAARSQKVLAISIKQEAEPFLDIAVDTRTQG